MLGRIWNRHGYVIRWVISLALLSIVVSKVDINVVRELYAQLDWWYYPVGLVLALLSNVFATKRWQLFEPSLTFADLYKANLISNYYAFLSGTTILADLLKLSHIIDFKKRRIELFASMLADKAIAFVGSSFVLLLGVLAADQDLNEAMMMFALFFSSLCAAILILVTSESVRHSLLRLLDSLAVHFRFTGVRKDSVARTFSQLFDYLSIKSRIMYALIYTILFNLTLTVIYSLWSHLFQIQIAPGSFIVICVWAQVATTLPLGVAGLGVRDVTTSALLVSMGVPEPTAAIATLSFYPLVLLVSLLGFVLSIIPNQQSSDKSDGLA